MRLTPVPWTTWQGLTTAEQARLRYALMRELSWIDWDGQPAWWWAKEHATLLDVKRASLMDASTRTTPHVHTWKLYQVPQPCGCARSYCAVCLNPQLPVHAVGCPYGDGEEEEDLESRKN